jgi:putative ABC transport system permease protein
MTSNSLKLALKVLSRRKVFTLISLAGITLTLVVLVVTAAVVDNILAPGEPQSRIGRMLFLLQAGAYGPHSSQTSNPGHAFLQPTVRNLPGAEATTVFSEVAEAAVYDAGRRFDVMWRRADAPYWRVHDFRFLEGSPFTASDIDGNRRVAVINDSLRHVLFGDGPAVGRELNLNGNMTRVAGVVPNVPITRLSAYADVWTPLPPPSDAQRKELFGDLSVVVLAKSSADIPVIQHEFAARVKRLPIDDPRNYNELRANLDPIAMLMARRLSGGERVGERAPMYAVIGVIVLTLLFMTLPALNLITLNLSRILERASEVGVRKAFGAPRRALVGQFIVENVVLTLIGGALAFVLAFVALRLFAASDLLPDAHFDLNLRVFGAGMLLAAFFGVFSGLYPAWKMSRLNPVNALRGGAL